MQHKQKLQELGIQTNDLTPKIKTMIGEYDEAVEVLKELKDKLETEDYDDEEEKEEINTNIAELEETINTLDEEIAEKIVAFSKGKQLRNAKVGNVQVAQTGGKVETGKKSNGIFWGILGIGALVLTLGSVNLFSGGEE
jgi:hypothetical protein